MQVVGDAGRHGGDAEAEAMRLRDVDHLVLGLGHAGADERVVLLEVRARHLAVDESHPLGHHVGPLYQALRRLFLRSGWTYPASWSAPVFIVSTMVRTFRFWQGIAQAAVSMPSAVARRICAMTAISSKIRHSRMILPSRNSKWLDPSMLSGAPLVGAVAGRARIGSLQQPDRRDAQARGRRNRARRCRAPRAVRPG